MSACRGLCHRGKFHATKAKASLGRPWCSHCEYSFRYEGRFCPCCGTTLRQRNRGRAAAKRREEGIHRY